jgi:uncharacterized protein YggE
MVLLRILAIFAVSTAAALSALAQTPASPPLITVTGTGVAFVEPNLATITLGTYVDAPTAREAQT